MAAPAGTETKLEEMSRTDRTLLLLAGLMEGGQEDDDTCTNLDKLTKLLNDDPAATKKDGTSICSVIDGDCVDTILCYLDMRQADNVRGHATLATSAYLKAAGEEGSRNLSAFFFDRVKRGTYDDYIVAFCVAAAIFPIVPDLTADLFLSEGFLSSLGPLMRRTWKSRKVETACLDMLNAACMNTQCREAVQKYCSDWLEEVVDQDPEQRLQQQFTVDPDGQVEGGSISMRRHSQHVQRLASVILAKIRAVPSTQPATEESQGRIQPAITTIDELSRMFAKTLLDDPEHGAQTSVEGLAYASIQPQVKEELASNKDFLRRLVRTLEEASPKSPTTYGALSVFVNLTRYLPTQTEEQKKISQLKAYANAKGKLPKPDPRNESDHVAERCKRVFEAGVTPVLVTHSKNGSPASLSLIISIINSISMTTTLRGQLAQQGAVKLLINAWTTLPEKEAPTRRTAAQALARILISTNPSLVFGGNRPFPQSTVIRPLASIIAPDPTAETVDLLPTFESLMALTNLASTDDDTRRSIIRLAWGDVEEQLLSPNGLVTKAAVELICNLMLSVEAVELYMPDPAARDSTQRSNRLNILVALADAEEEGTRSAAGGALASLTAYEPVIKGILARERGIEIILGLCADDDENLRHRGAFIVYNLISTDGETGKQARTKLKEARGIETLTECAKKSRRSEVVEVTVTSLKLLVEDI